MDSDMLYEYVSKMEVLNDEYVYHQRYCDAQAMKAVESDIGRVYAEFDDWLSDFEFWKSIGIELNLLCLYLERFLQNLFDGDLFGARSIVVKRNFNYHEFLTKVEALENIKKDIQADYDPVSLQKGNEPYQYEDDKIKLVYLADDMMYQAELQRPDSKVVKYGATPKSAIKNLEQYLSQEGDKNEQ